MTQISVGLLADDQMLTGPLERRRVLLERARSAGLGHLFVADHVSFHVGLGMDGLIQVATAAALVPDLSLHIGVYLLALRHPVLVARQIATVCESAPGRLVLGVGVGGEDRHEIEVCGVDPRTRGRRTDESLIALRGLLSGEPFSHECEFFAFDEAWIRPAPDPPVPIVIGGRSDAALRRAGRHGDGWLGAWCSPRRFREAISQVEAAAGERSVAWRHGIQVWVGLDRDTAHARERLAARMQEMYRIPFERFEKYSPYGSPEAVGDFLAAYGEAGCRDFNIMAVAESSEHAVDGVAAIREHLMR
jgi:alkanesulfonate monooxygenase SsuD/methylene tetrahydromethanopterin reductase-like flavin-dependent oxidoreductase (luciferase family)